MRTPGTPDTVMLLIDTVSMCFGGVGSGPGVAPSGAGWLGWADAASWSSSFGYSVISKVVRASRICEISRVCWTAAIRASMAARAAC